MTQWKSIYQFLLQSQNQSTKDLYLCIFTHGFETACYQTIYIFDLVFLAQVSSPQSSFFIVLLSLMHVSVLR